jgi:hypothetical protein
MRESATTPSVAVNCSRIASLIASVIGFIFGTNSGVFMFLLGKGCCPQNFLPSAVGSLGQCGATSSKQSDGSNAQKAASSPVAPPSFQSGGAVPLNVTLKPPAEAIATMKKFEEAVNTEIPPAFEEAVTTSGRDCRCLSSEQSRELLSNHFLKDDSDCQGDRKAAATIPEDFFSVDETTRDGYMQQLANITLVKDMNRQMLSRIQGSGDPISLDDANRSLASAPSDGKTIAESGPMKAVVGLIRETYATDAERLRALKNFLGCPYTQGCSAALGTAFGIDHLDFLSPLHFSAIGGGTRFMSVHFNADTTVTLEGSCSFAGYEPYLTEQYSTLIQKDSFAHMAVKYTVGTPFDPNNPSSHPDGWENAPPGGTVDPSAGETKTAKDTGPPTSLIATKVEFAEIITR